MGNFMRVGVRGDAEDAPGSRTCRSPATHDMLIAIGGFPLPGLRCLVPQVPTASSPRAAGFTDKHVRWINGPHTAPAPASILGRMFD